MLRKKPTLGSCIFYKKNHKRLANVPGRPVISNCGTPTEVSEYLDFLLKPVMQNVDLILKILETSLEKIKRLGKIPDSAILVTAVKVVCYPNVPHDSGLLFFGKKA